MLVRSQSDCTLQGSVDEGVQHAGRAICNLGCGKVRHDCWSVEFCHHPSLLTSSRCCSSLKRASAAALSATR